MSDTQQYSGSCRCGQIQFTVTGVPESSHICHCYACRVHTSAVGMHVLKYSKTQLTHNVTDELLKNNKIYIGHFGSDPIKYYKCLVCDTRVFGQSQAEPHVYITHPSLLHILKLEATETTVKSLPKELQTQYHIFYNMRLQGLEVDDGLPKFSMYSDSDTITVTKPTPSTVQINDDTVSEGQCQCGNIQFSVTGNPLAAGYCDCYRCRVIDSTLKRVACFFNTVHSNIDTLDKSTYENRTVADGFEHLTYIRCCKCDVKVYQHNSKGNRYLIFPSLMKFARGDENNIGGILPEKWRPTVEIFYGSRLGGHEVNQPNMTYYVKGRDSEKCDYQGKAL